MPLRRRLCKTGVLWQPWCRRRNYVNRFSGETLLVTSNILTISTNVASAHRF